MSLPVVIRAGLDTLIVSYRGEIAGGVIERLDALRRLAQDKDEPQPFAASVFELMVQPSAFGRWSWRLVHPWLSIVAKRKTAPGSAIAQVRFSSFGLSTQDNVMLLAVAEGMLSALGELTELSVSRADVCVDFQGWVPKRGEMLNVVTPAIQRGLHGTESADQTFRFGEKTLVRLYDKTAELRKSKKVWLPGLWRSMESYESGKPVWRAEFQASRDTLRDLGDLSADAIARDPGPLLEHGLRWCQLRVPDGGKNKTRWPEDERWTVLRTAAMTEASGMLLHREPKVSSLMSLDDVIGRVVGQVATAAAYFEETEWLPALQRLSYGIELHLIQSGIDFPALVEKKRRRILSDA